MAEILVRREEELQQCLDKAVAELDSGAHEPILVKAGLSLSEALSFVEKTGKRRGFIFVSVGEHDGQRFGDLYIFFDPSAVHEISATKVASALLAWLWPWCSGDEVGLLEAQGRTRVSVLGGFREPDQSLWLSGRGDPSVVVEVGYSQTSPALQERLDLWTGPSSQTLVAIGVKVQYPALANVAPRMAVMMQLKGQQRPSAVVNCGAGSGCVSPYMFDYTLFVPLDKLLVGVPWLVRMLISLQLAVQVPVYRAVRWGLVALGDVLVGRRSPLSIASACLRSLRGPWWGVVPLDAFAIRAAVFRVLGARRLVRSA